MNIENIQERLLRAERERDEARQALTGRTVSCAACEQMARERDEARAEVERLRTGEGGWTATFLVDEIRAERERLRAEVERVRESNEDSVAMVERLGAELARLRAAANERAITELGDARREFGMQERTTGIRSDWNDAIAAMDLLLSRRIAALRAETPAAPQPAPSGGVERAIARLNDLREWAGRECWGGLKGGAVYDRVVRRIDADIAALRAEQQAAPVPPPVTPPAEPCLHGLYLNGVLVPCALHQGHEGQHVARFFDVNGKPQTFAVPDEPKVTPPADPWTPSGKDYDRSIHWNPSAEAWADFFVATYPGLADKREVMLGWFANAMMAMHDSIKGPANGEMAETMMQAKVTPPADAPSRPSVLRKLFFVQDSDRPMHVVATSWQHAVDRWVAQIRVENGDHDDYEPDGVMLVAAECEHYPALLLPDDALAGRGGAQ